MERKTLKAVARKLLRAHQVWGATPDALADALAVGTPRWLSDGETLCEEGAAADSLYVLLRGEVSVLRRDDQGNNQPLATLAAPTLVGHMGLVDGSPRSATCIAASEVGCMILSRRDFQTLQRASTPAGSALRRLILSSMIRQLSLANTRIRELADEEAGAPTPQPDDLLKLAGVLDGWSVDTNSLRQRIEFVEDEDMRRTREARQKK